MSSRQASSRGAKRGSTSTSSTKPTTNTTPPTNTTNTKNSGPYDRNFQQKLIDGGVYPHGYRYPDGRVPAKPKNWESINQRLTEPRPSLSPSRFTEEEYEKFIQADVGAFKEDDVTKSVIPFIEGKIRDARCVSGKIPFTNLDPLTKDNLVPGNPDLYYGARPEQLDRGVREDAELRGRIIPSTQDDLPIAPNFFLAAKGPSGSGEVARRQASYDGALGARGMHSLQSYGQGSPIYDKNAYTITSIYNDGQLRMYTSHPAQPPGPGTRSEYHMNQLRAFAMTDNRDAFRDGATAFRNARDWTEEQRNEAIKRANERAIDVYGGQPTTASAGSTLFSSFTSEVFALVSATSLGEDGKSKRRSAHTTRNEVSYSRQVAQQDSETSMDELASDVNPPAKRSSSKPPQPRRRKKTSGVAGSQKLRQSQRFQSRNKDLPSPGTLTEVMSTPFNYNGQPGRRITHEGKTKFVPDSSWTACT
jgi:hypothetical protein